MPHEFPAIGSVWQRVDTRGHYEVVEINDEDNEWYASVLMKGVNERSFGDILRNNIRSFYEMFPIQVRR